MLLAALRAATDAASPGLTIHVNEPRVLCPYPDAASWHPLAATRLQRLAAREDAQFLAAWCDRWEAAEDYNFTHVRPPATFAIVVNTDAGERQP